MLAGVIVLLVSLVPKKETKSEPTTSPYLYDKEVQDKVVYEKYDIVLANILADVLEALTPEVTRQMKPGSLYITSGIIDDKEECVKEAILKAGLEIVEINYQNEWVAITARKPE